MDVGRREQLLDPRRRRRVAAGIQRRPGGSLPLCPGVERTRKSCGFLLGDVQQGGLRLETKCALQPIPCSSDDCGTTLLLLRRVAQLVHRFGPLFTQLHVPLQIAQELGHYFQC